MQHFKLEKDCVLYKTQFEKYMLDIFGDHRLDRYSLDLDGILFRIKYITKHKRDLDKIPELQEKFTNIAIQLRKCFGEFLFNFLAQIITIPEPFKLDNIVDILAHDVKMDPNYVKFKMVLISDSKEYIEYVDSAFPDNEVFNMFPNEYFRFYTDSYNDGIAKAYPELFENKHQDKIGVGADGDVFCHNFTFQTGERCSLNCTYCVPAGIKVTLSDYSMKNIEDIQVGDKVLAVDEYHPVGKEHTLRESEVTHVFKRETNGYFKISHRALKEPICITGEHPVKTERRGWIPVNMLRSTDKILISSIDPYDFYSTNFKNPSFIMNKISNSYHYYKTQYIGGFKLENIKEKCTVYNLETTEHTYAVGRLLVHNCYQFNKSEMRMSFETAKKFIDNLLTDQYGYINQYNSPAIIMEFIGGEPLLEINLTRKIYEYFLDRSYELNHPWFTLHRLSICSNGMQYFDKEVQDFFKEYSSQISFNISIDGNKELHDACRVQPNGEGSYDIDMCALNHYNKHFTPERNSKMTLAPSNISYLFDSVVNFINNGMTVININCIFEEGWNQETAKMEYYQLKKLAEYILENDLDHLYIAIFNERQEDVMPKEQDGSFCGGAGSMLAMRPNGQFYPCIRYMPSSVGNNVKDLCIGTVDTGIHGREEGSEIIKMLDRITRRAQNNDICYECPISNDCASCLALGHTVFGTPNKRTNFICIQMIAEALANVFYWNALLIKHPEYNLDVRKNNVPDKWALLVIDEEELDYLKKLEAYAMIIKMER